MSGPDILLPGYECQRCGWRWYTHLERFKGNRPRVCPKCKSVYWDRPRRESQGVDKEASVS